MGDIKSAIEGYFVYYFCMSSGDNNRSVFMNLNIKFIIEPSAKDCKNPVESFHANEHEVQNENEEVTRREISRRDGSRGSVG